MRTVVDFILDCCRLDENGKTKLQITRDPEKEIYSNVNYSDFVVLCRARSELQPIISIFNQVGIPYVSHKDTTLFKGLEAQHWLVLLKAIGANNFIGQNRKLFRLALTTNFFGHTFADAADEKFNRNDSEEMNKILSWQRLAKDKKWEELFNDILTSSCLLETLSNVKNMSSLAKYTQIGDICIEFLFQGKSLDELIRFLF
jgi:ATP-dependent exoDNAse (exonuclease V) beta subunit